MTGRERTRKRPEDRAEFRRRMADAFADLLEEKGLLWRKDWKGRGGNAPHNAVTRASYRGVNAFRLGLTSLIRGYSDPRWVTMVQIIDREQKYHPKERWKLRAGSEADYVEYWIPYDRREKKPVSREAYEAAKKEGRAEDFAFLPRYTPVFNASEVDGMPPYELLREEDLYTDPVIRKLSREMGVPILFDGGDRAYYSPRRDQIHLPSPASFESEYAFGAAALHELSHATGHPQRLGRPKAGPYGSPGYAYEELVAEICACFMGSELTAVPDARHLENHRAYVAGWVRAVREKPEILTNAIADAQKAARYLDWKAGLITEKEYRETFSDLPEERKRRTPEYER